MAMSSSAEGSPNWWRNSAAIVAPSSGSKVWWAAPLSAMARWNRPSVAGMASMLQTLNAPADSPPMVIRSGSPPKADTFSCTQARAATWSSVPLIPQVAKSPPRWLPRSQNPSAPSR